MDNELGLIGAKLHSLLINISRKGRSMVLRL